MDITTFIKAVFLGIVEGVTEFIPVSSTGHLIICQTWLNFTGKKEFAFTIFIQLGAILAVIWLYRKKLFSLAVQWPTDAKARQFIYNLILGTLPAVVIGLPTEDWIEAHFFNPFSVALALISGGIAIFIIEKHYRTPHINTVDDISWQKALAIGMIQVLSIIFPGVSRSGATIMGAMALGLSRTAAAEFSFFLAIPALCGASILKLFGIHHILSWADFPVFSIGFLVSWISALWVIKGFLAFISHKTFHAFAWYRILFGLLVVFLYWKNWVQF